MSWLSDRWGDVKRAFSSDEAKLMMLGGLGGYGLFGKAAMNKFLTSSMLQNMAKRYATSYLTSTAMGKPHAHKGALSSALWSLPFQAWKNYGMTQDLMGGDEGKDVLRAGTDTPWWKLMLGQGKESDPELDFMGMFTKDVPIRGKSGADEGILAALGLGSKGPVTGYKKGFDMLGMMPEVIGHSQAGWTPRELEDQGEERTRRQQALMDEIMQNPLYGDENMYRWPGWGLTQASNRGGIMQALQGGGDFLEDLVSQEDPAIPDLSEMEITPFEAQEDYGPVGMPEGEFPTSSSIENIPPEILEGIVNQRDPLMEKIMEMIMRMIAPTLGEDEQMPMMGPSGMGEMGDYLGPSSEMGVEEQGDLGLGMQSGGDYTRGAHVMGPGTGTSDSVNAKLSDGEFVVTANAVKNAGGGDRREGAKRMYNMMNRLDPQSARPGEEPQIV